MPGKNEAQFNFFENLDTQWPIFWGDFGVKKGIEKSKIYIPYYFLWCKSILSTRAGFWLNPYQNFFFASDCLKMLKKYFLSEN